MIIDKSEQTSSFDNHTKEVESNAILYHKTVFPAQQICQQKSEVSAGGSDDNTPTRADVNIAESRTQIDGSTKHKCRGNFWPISAVVSCFIANVLSGGYSNIYGVLYTYMREPLGVSEYQLSWIGAIMTGFHGGSSILASVIIDSKGCRVTTILGPFLATSGFIISSQTTNISILYLTLGALPGIGVCLGYIATMVHVNRQFTKWRPFAVSVSVVGTAVGILVWPPLTTTIADTVGWRGTLLVHGALMLHLLPCALLIKPETMQAKQESDNNLDKTTSFLSNIKKYLETFKIRGVVLAYMSNIFTGLGCYTMTTFIPFYVMTTSPDMTSTDAALIISLVGFGSITGRIVFACASMVHVKAPQYILLFSLFLGGISNLVVPLCGNMASHTTNGAIYGIALGGVNSMASVALGNWFGIEHISKTFGTYLTCLGIGSLCGAPLESYLASVWGMPQLIFYSAGGFYLIGFLLIVTLLMMDRPLRRRKSINISVAGVNNDGFTTDHATVIP